jgi:hypothetical protein
MHKYLIALEEQTALELERCAQIANLKPEEYVVGILNLMLVRPHNMEQEEMAEGYKDCGALNLKLSE